MLILNAKQREQLAEFNSNLGIVFFTSGIAPLFTLVDKVNWYMVLLGLVLSIAFLVISLLTLKENYAAYS